MKNNASQNRFENARKNLSDALLNLEKIVKNKLHESIIQTRIVGANEIDESGSKAASIQKDEIITNLNLEINSLQQTIADIGIETEFLNEKNKIFAERIGIARKKSESLIKNVEAELLRIETLIKDEEK